MSTVRGKAPRTEAGRPIGTIEGTTWKKRVKGSKHFLRAPAGIAADLTALAEASSLGATSVEVEDLETQATYTAPISAFFQHGVVIDRGFGRQRVLQFRWWSAKVPGAAQQLGLFDSATSGA